MSSGRIGASAVEITVELTGTSRLALFGLGCAVLGAAVQLVASSAITAAAAMTLGVVGVILAGLAIVRRPNDSRILGLARSRHWRLCFPLGQIGGQCG